MTGATPLADGQLAASSSDASGSAAPAVSELSATTPRAAAGEPRVDSAPQTPADSAPPSPITVPAAATMLPYPVTPYVNFDFGLYAPSDAGRTADGSAALPTSR